MVSLKIGKGLKNRLQKPLKNEEKSLMALKIGSPLQNQIPYHPPQSYFAFAIANPLPTFSRPNVQRICNKML